MTDKIETRHRSFSEPVEYMRRKRLEESEFLEYIVQQKIEEIMQRNRYMNIDPKKNIKEKK